LTIEDPSEAFQDMRDKVDYRTLTSAGVFKSIKAPIPLSFQGKKDWKEETRKEWKLAPRQFARVLELSLRKDLLHSKAAVEESVNASPNKRKVKLQESEEKEYRLLVKERLARMNYEILAPMSRTEKRETLQQVSLLRSCTFFLLLGID
jgi:histone acetyltransferase 1